MQPLANPNPNPRRLCSCNKEGLVALIKLGSFGGATQLGSFGGATQLGSFGSATQLGSFGSAHSNSIVEALASLHS